MKTVQDYLELGLAFVDGDKICGVTGDSSSGEMDIFDRTICAKKYSKGAAKIGIDCYARARWTPSSFAWRNNDGVKPEYSGAMKVELSSGDVIFNCGKTSEFDWRINDGINPKIMRWKPIVISAGIAGCWYSFDINECKKPSFLQQKPKINLIVPDSLKAEVRRVGGEVNVTISQKDKQEDAANNLEKVISIDAVCDAIKKVSPKEDKPMKPAYTAEMHARNELPPVGSKVKVCIKEAGFYVDEQDVKFEGKAVTVKAAFSNTKSEKIVAVENEDGNCYCYIIECIKPIPKTIKVNGFDVPAPMSEVPELGSEYFVIDMLDEGLFCSIEWEGDDKDNQWLSNGIIHSTKSAAIAHAKAMLGINPNPARGGDGYDRNVLSKTMKVMRFD